MSLVMTKRAYVGTCIGRYFCAISDKFGVSRQISIKAPNIMFQGKPFRVGVALIHADRRTLWSSRFTSPPG